MDVKDLSSEVLVVELRKVAAKLDEFSADPSKVASSVADERGKSFLSGLAAGIGVEQ